jgi:hypothetical protein
LIFILAVIGLIVGVKGMKELGLEEYMTGGKKRMEVHDDEGFSQAEYALLRP